MARSKRDSLERAGALHRRPDRVRSPLFARLDFFDAEDKLQVKYEMLRSHQVDRVPVSRAAALFGYSRQAYYQIQRGFEREGVAGLWEKKRGRKGPTKCTPEIVAFLVRQKQAAPELSGRELAERLREEKGVEVHRRTVEKIVAGLPAASRRKKKRSHAG
ncbi:MAG: helix-turn-helix domain-containing protein [Thermoanaerobaculia bacterium]